MSGGLYDCEGIAFASADLSGVDTAVCGLPLVEVGATKAGAFTLVRSGEGSNPSNPLGAGQDTINFAGHTVIYGLGLGAVDMAAQMTVGPTYTYSPSQVIPHSMVIGGGTYSTGTPTIVGANFNVLTNPSPDEDTYVADVDIIPEPATLGLLLMGGLALLRRR